jgi:hypothetical protein
MYLEHQVNQLVFESTLIEILAIETQERYIKIVQAYDN